MVTTTRRNGGDDTGRPVHGWLFRRRDTAGSTLEVDVRCEVPFALPYRQYRPETMGDSWWTLSWLRGTYFPLSVTDVDTEARTAQGLRMVSTTHITVELTEDQVEAAGLPLSHSYQVTGRLLDAEGEPVELPRIGTLTVPLRWLHPMDTPVSGGHHDASLQGF